MDIENTNVVIVPVLYDGAVQFCSGAGMGFMLLPQSMPVFVFNLGFAVRLLLFHRHGLAPEELKDRGNK